MKRERETENVCVCVCVCVTVKQTGFVLKELICACVSLVLFVVGETKRVGVGRVECVGKREPTHKSPPKERGRNREKWR